MMVISKVIVFVIIIINTALQGSEVSLGVAQDDTSVRMKGYQSG